MNWVAFISVLVIILTIPSCSQHLEISLGETVHWWATEFLLLFSFIYYKRRKLKSTLPMPWPIMLFIVWVLASGVYGIFLCEGYWDYKALVNHLLIYLMPLCYYFVALPSNLSEVTRRWCGVACIVFWLLVPFMQGEAVGRYLAPFAFMLMFWPFFPKQWVLIVIGFSLLTLVYGVLGARSVIIKFGSAALISICFLLPHLFKRRLLLGISYTFFVAPLVCFMLAISGIFNVFEFDKYTSLGDVEVTNSFDSNETESLGADTRSFLYEETITSSLVLDHVWYGHSLARGYISPFFGGEDLMHRNERNDSEVAILNVYCHMGLIGVIIYFLIFFGALMSVRRHSQNRVMYVVACYVSFRWLFSWVEDSTHFDLNNLFLWTEISMCYSPFFLNKTDAEIELWLRNFFHTDNYIALLKWRKSKEQALNEDEDDAD